MSDDLNKQYFKAKETHNKNYFRKGYVIWVLIACGLVAFYTVRQYFERRKVEKLTKEIKDEFLNKGVLTGVDTFIRSELTGSNILVLRNSLYEELQKEGENIFLVVKNDSTGLTYLTTRLIPDANYNSSISQWKDRLVSGGATYTLSNISKDTVDGLPIERAEIAVEGSDHQMITGSIKITKKGPLFYVFQIFALSGAWEELMDERIRVEKSLIIGE